MIRLTLPIRSWFRRFRVEERGSIAVEGVVMVVPILILFFSAFVFFHAFRLSTLNDKAGYVVADMLSRQTEPVNDNFLNGLQDVYAFLMRNQGELPRMRVSLITYDADAQAYGVVWSQSTSDGTLAPEVLTNAIVAQVADRIPVMPDGENVLLVETFVDYTPPVNVGIGARTFSTFIVTRPRYAPQIVYAGS
jgi:Flp pilus assembly protein TadG